MGLATTAIQYWARGDDAAAERVLHEAGGPVARAYLAWIRLLDGRPDEALTAAESVLGDPRVVTPAASAAVVAASLLGLFDRAAAAAERARGVAPESALLQQAQCLSLILAGWPGEALRMARQSHRSNGGGADPTAGGWSALLGLVARLRGEPRTAAAALGTAVRLLEGGDTRRLLGPCVAELAGAFALGGDEAAATRTLRRAAALPRVGRGLDPWFALNQAWTTVAVGDGTLAVRQAQRAAALAMSTGQLAVEALARYDVARFGDPGAARQRLAKLAGRVRGGFVSIMAEAAAALADNDANALDRASDAFTERGVDLFAAEAATAAAALHRRVGRAVLADRSASRTAGFCPDATTPLLRLTAELVVLTTRERDVAALAAGGLTSQAIGDRLRLSVRTVDNYLGRVYNKVGVANRRGLIRLIPAHRALPRARSASSGERR